MKIHLIIYGFGEWRLACGEKSLKTDACSSLRGVTCKRCRSTRGKGRR